MRDQISILDYEKDMQLLLSKLPKKTLYLDYDCIVCLKRSGFILGVYLSNKGKIPLFTQSEISSIPKSFKRILVVDDKCQTGKSLNKIINKLTKLEVKQIESAVMYKEGNYSPNYVVKETSNRIDLWYENLNN